MLSNTIAGTNKLTGLKDCKIWNGSAIIKYMNKGYKPYQLSLWLARGERTEGTEVIRHLCGNGACIVPDHLMIGTHAENAQDKIIHGTIVNGDNHPNSRVTEEVRERIRTSTKSSKELMKQYGVSGHVIEYARNRERVKARSKAAYQRMRALPITQGHWDRAIETMRSKSTEIPGVPNDSRFILNTPCYAWQGATNAAGYGTITVRGRHLRVHRVSATVYHNGYRDICDTMVVRHLCRTKKCWNPEHIKIGTKKENSVDTVHAGFKAAKVTPDQVLNIYAAKDKKSVGELATQYNVSNTAIRAIHSQKTWSHVTSSATMIQRK